MIEDRREVGDLRQNVVHFEVPFGKPIEEVYDGVHNGPVLGSGISGLVRLVTHKATGIKYAVKVLDLGLVDTAEGLKQLRNEIFIMCQLDHPNVVRLEEVYESHSEIFLVLELATGGELFDRLDEQPDYHYTEAECAKLVKQMLSAVRYLHSKGIIHRDLKLENFLFSDTTPGSELKMIDFGLSKHFNGEIQHEAVGTPYTVAPEVIRGRYDERCDIWAIGVITFLLLSGEPPFGGCGGPESLMQVRENILSGHFEFEPADIWEHVSDAARGFIKALLVTDPKQRPTAHQAQKHNWLQEWASRSRKAKDNVLSPNVVKALVNFKEYSDMRKLLCEVLSFTLLPDQIKELRREFEKMDTDGSGEISLSALKQVLMTNAGAGSLGALTEEEVTDIFDAMRVRKTDTRIHWHEFIAAGLSQCQVDDRNLRLAFERLDSDHKGYITLDDIMDLMGSDGIASEEAMERMWNDNIRAIKGRHALITYDDFLLLMKGQSREHKEAPPSKARPNGGARVSLEVLPEGKQVVSTQEVLIGNTTPPSLHPVRLPSGDKVTVDGRLLEDASGVSWLGDEVTHVNSAPNTPQDHKRLLEVNEDDDDDDGPLTMDDDGDIFSGLGKSDSRASFTPPQSPIRGATDYITPLGGRRSYDLTDSTTADELAIPGLPTSGTHQRRRSRSLGEYNGEGDDDAAAANNPYQDEFAVVADVLKDAMLPETAQNPPRDLQNAMQDETKSALQVNRKLYRAHRQMRHAVLDASKRFEEERARHAREIILAQREVDDGKGASKAGLVMRHGHKKQVSSEAIRSFMEQDSKATTALVEKANRRGGRGRRSRKKTISDIRGMMSSMGTDEMGSAAALAAAELEEKEAEVGGTISTGGSTSSIDGTEGKLRKPTVPGEFRKTEDPFVGRIGAASFK